MGLFDDVRCDMLLPESPPEDVVKEGTFGFQTKDLPGPCLGKVHITKEGRLLLDGKDLEYHGMLSFMAIGINDRGRFDGRSWDYEAKFTDGVCVNIQRIEDADE